MTEPDGIPAFALGRIPRITFGAGSFARVPEVVRCAWRAGPARDGRAVAGGVRAARDPPGWPGRRRRSSWQARSPILDEPSPAVVDGALVAHRGAAAEVVLGIGGGSVLDAAKAIAGLLRTGSSITDHLEGVGRATPLPRARGPARRGAHHGRHGLRGDPQRRDQRARPGRLEALLPRRAAGRRRRRRRPGPPRGRGPGADRRERHGCRDAAAGGLRVHEGRAGDRRAGARRAGGGPGRTARVARGPGWPGRAGRAIPDGLRGAPVGDLPRPCRPRRGPRACLAAGRPAADPARHRLRDDPRPGSRPRTWRPSRRGRRAHPRWRATRTLGRLLGGLSETTPDARARAAWSRSFDVGPRHSRSPACGAYGLDEAGIPAIVADARGSSMRTNPVVLTDEELDDGPARGALIVRASRPRATGPAQMRGRVVGSGQSSSEPAARVALAAAPTASRRIPSAKPPEDTRDGPWIRARPPRSRSRSPGPR